MSAAPPLDLLRSEEAFNTSPLLTSSPWIRAGLVDTQRGVWRDMRNTPWPKRAPLRRQNTQAFAPHIVRDLGTRVHKPCTAADMQTLRVFSNAPRGAERFCTVFPTNNNTRRTYRAYLCQQPIHTCVTKAPSLLAQPRPVAATYMVKDCIVFTSGIAGCMPPPTGTGAP